jgi:hypothetical protein
MARRAGFYTIDLARLPRRPGPTPPVETGAHGWALCLAVAIALILDLIVNR